MQQTASTKNCQRTVACCTLTCGDFRRSGILVHYGVAGPGGCLGAAPRDGVPRLVVSNVVGGLRNNHARPNVPSLIDRPPSWRTSRPARATACEAADAGAVDVPDDVERKGDHRDVRGQQRRGTVGVLSRNIWGQPDIRSPEQRDSTDDQRQAGAGLHHGGRHTGRLADLLVRSRIPAASFETAIAGPDTTRLPTPQAQTVRFPATVPCRTDGARHCSSRNCSSTAGSSMRIRP